MALPLKLSRNKQHAIIRFFVWAKSWMQMRFNPVYDAECLMKSTIRIWCEKMLSGQKFASYTKVQSDVCLWLGQWPASFFASIIQKLVHRWDKMFEQTRKICCKMKHQCLTLIEVTFDLLSYVFLISMLFVTCYLCCITGGENNTQIDCVLWTDDITIMPEIKFSKKCISWIFFIFEKLTKWHCFVTYLWNSPRRLWLVYHNDDDQNDDDVGDKLTMCFA